MSLKHIKIKGFKSIQSLDLEMKNINILLGANGAGKTNFISVFTFLNQLSQGKLQSYVQSEGGADSFFHFGTRTTEQIKISVQMETKIYHAVFQSIVADDAIVLIDLLVYDIELGSDPWDIRGERVYPRIGNSGFPSSSKSSACSQAAKNYLGELRTYHFHDTSNLARFKKTNKVINYHYLEKDAANLAPFLYFLKNEYQNSYQQIIATIQAVAPFFHDFYLEPYGQEGDENILLRWTHSKQDNPFSANVLSDGTARFICLVTLFLQPQELRPSTIIVDEPELGLHPAALRILADIIKSTSKETQVICSTQSVTFANHFKPKDFIVVDAKDGVSTFHRPSKKDLKQWLKDYKMGDIWEKNLIGGRPAW